MEVTGDLSVGQITVQVLKAEFCTLDIRRNTAVLKLNRPPVNALNSVLVEELISASDSIRDAIDRHDVRVVVIAADGKTFCAGADLKERFNMSEEQVLAGVKAIRQMTACYADIPVPTICAIQGSAIGGGFELALATDIRIAAETAKVGLRETALAIIPGAGGTQRLTRLIGPGNALYWIATAKLFPAEEALRFGALTLVVPSSQLDSTTREVADVVSSNGPLAVRQAKKAIHDGLDRSLTDALALELACYQKTISTRDRLEGLAAFKEKRPPRYQGK
jgi:enoyl-CoA hydratase/carnithine racemase